MSASSRTITFGVALAALLAGGSALAAPTTTVAAAPTAAQFTGLAPARLLDTRAGGTTIDQQGAGAGALAAGTTTSVTVTARGGVPATGVGAVALNVTAADATAPSFLTVFPAGAPRPTASNLNFVGGQTIPNMVIVPVGANGAVSIFNSNGSTDVIVDVLGWFAAGAGFTGLNPSRLLDTRAGQSTVDGSGAGGGALGASGVAHVQVLGRGGVLSTGVGSVALNVTATNATAATYVTAFPSGASKPTASNLNVLAGQTIPNMVIVPVGADGSVSLYNNAGSVDLIVDVLGYFPTGGSFTAINPYRADDTRNDVAWDGEEYSASPLDQLKWLTVTGVGGVPASGVSAVALNVTVTQPSDGGYVSIFPRGGDLPTASNLNFVAGQTIPNMVIVPVDPTGQITLYVSSGVTHIVVDVLGYFVGAPFTRPAQHEFDCSSATMKAALTKYLSIDAAGVSDAWAWDALDLDLSLVDGLVVDSFDPAAGTLVAATPTLAFTMTRSFVAKVQTGSLEERLAFSGGGKYLDGSTAPIFDSFWNRSVTIGLTRTATTVSVTSCS